MATMPRLKYFFIGIILMRIGLFVSQHGLKRLSPYHKTSWSFKRNGLATNISDETRRTYYDVGAASTGVHGQAQNVVTELPNITNASLTMILPPLGNILRYFAAGKSNISSFPPNEAKPMLDIKQSASEVDISNCNFTTKPRRVHQHRNVTTFYPVLQDELYIYAGYYDTRFTVPLVRVLATELIVPIHKERWCQLWYEHKDWPEVVPTYRQVVPETLTNKFGAAVYSCQPNNTEVPYAVTISSEVCEQAKYVLPVNFDDGTAKANFSVCIAPLHHYYHVPQEVVEMIEFNRLFGAERFTFYIQAARPNVVKYLQHYARMNIVDIVEFILPIDTKRNKTIDVHYHGQLTALLDCVYRNLHHSRYVAHIDVDEIIVPRHQVLNTWGKVVAAITRSSHEVICSFIYHAAFYNIAKYVSKNMTAHNHHVQAVTYTERLTDIQPIPYRAKTIMDMDHIMIPGVHFVRGCEGSTADIVEVPTTIALLHHYTYKSFHMTHKKAMVEDAFLLAYREEIIERIDKVHHMVNHPD